MKKFIIVFLLFATLKANAFINFGSSFQSSTFNEGKDYYYITFSIENAKKDQISAIVKNGVLLVEVEKEKGYIKNAFTLPFDTDLKSIEATYSDNILNFKIKKDKNRKETEIKIKVN